VRHVPGNSGDSGRVVDNLALGALPTPLQEANLGGAARGGVDVARGALPTAVLLNRGRGFRALALILRLSDSTRGYADG
jgi:hypothetical protein